MWEGAGVIGLWIEDLIDFTVFRMTACSSKAGPEKTFNDVFRYHNTVRFRSKFSLVLCPQNRLRLRQGNKPFNSQLEFALLIDKKACRYPTHVAKRRRQSMPN
jgi:hypothetical protein